MPLTEEAKKELQEAIRIVREDRFEQYARTTLGKHVPKEEKKEEEEVKPKDELVEKEGITPPPPKEEAKEEEKEEEKPKRKSAYWGELLDD